jgi:long-chain acyl-CoA synthetase
MGTKMSNLSSAQQAPQPLPGLIKATIPETVVDLLQDALRSSPEEEALVFGEVRLNYREYSRAVACFAAEMALLGIGPGARVLTVLGNSSDACIAYFGIWASGAALVPLNPLYTARELGGIIANSEPALMIVGAQQRDVIEALLEQGPLPRVVFLEDLAPGRHAASAADVPVVRSLAAAGSLALIQYTGGTTGTPKGVELTHGSIVTNVLQRELLLPLPVRGERILCVMPLFHSYAMAMALFLAVRAHSTLVIMARYRPDDLMELVEREGITVFPGSPTIYTGLMAHPQFPGTNWSTVHTCYSGSAALSADVLQRWEAQVHAPIFEGYGQTEAGPILTFNPVGHRKTGSVGVAVQGTEVQIVDVETGTRILKTGEVGEVRARGPQIMRGYRNRAEETAASLRDGWLYTSDIGELDDDGYLYIRDRKKDLVITGGYNVYPREIEEVLLSHPAVVEAAVIGRPDEYKGELLHAYIAVREGAEATTDIHAELLSLCTRNLAKYKIPSAFHLVAAIPKTAVNKIDKSALRREGTP